MKILIILSMLILLVGCQKNEVVVTPTPSSIPTETPVVEPSIEPTVEPTTKPLDHGSFNSLYVIMNKVHSFSSSDIPSDLVLPDVSTTQGGLYLREEASTALESMFESAMNDGIYLRLGSAYRAYDTQATIYNNYVASDGELEANRYSAKPGESEHQTGLAVDISDDTMSAWLSSRFKDTNEGIWLSENSYKYGFILRYPEGKEDVTGYIFEPWHFRYIGIDEAQKIYESGKTLEEYYNY